MAGIPSVMRFFGIIPARFGSSRLPGKPLLNLAGRPLVEWVYLRASRSALLDELVVATDDARIFEAVQGFGGKAIMTRRDHASGTDRVAEVAASHEADVFVNIQGDEPLIPPETIDAVCKPFCSDSKIAITTARVCINDEREIASPHVNKVVVDRNQWALYFSRSVIPYPRRAPVTHYKHVGIYAYRRDVLLSLSKLEPSELEQAEALEQLRFLEYGMPILVVEVTRDSPGVDVESDLERVTQMLENEPRTPPL